MGIDGLRRFDVYPKTHDDLKVRTVGGAVISVCCYLFAAVLFVSEFRQYRSLETIDRFVRWDSHTSPLGSHLLGRPGP
jgi:multisubunit Na+/H+ antiporter MnhG subunit